MNHAEPGRATDFFNSLLGDRNLDIHKPKPWRGLPEFAKEIGSIVIGVLIALGAQQVAEDWQWRQCTADARICLAREVGAMSGQLYERLIVQRCLLDRLAVLADGLEKNGAA